MKGELFSLRFLSKYEYNFNFRAGVFWHAEFEKNEKSFRRTNFEEYYFLRCDVVW
jgi:hypothetical protein